VWSRAATSCLKPFVNKALLATLLIEDIFTDWLPEDISVKESALQAVAERSSFATKRNLILKPGSLMGSAKSF
jgi:hypothetical protein